MRYFTYRNEIIFGPTTSLRKSFILKIFFHFMYTNATLKNKLICTNTSNTYHTQIKLFQYSINQYIKL